MRFFHNNLIDATGAVFTPVSEESTLPASNVSNELIGKVWRSKTVASPFAFQQVVFDLLSAKDATAFIAAAHTVLSTHDTYTCDSSTNNFASNLTSNAITFSEGTMAVTFTSDTKRYWRFKVYDATDDVSAFDVGRIFLGTYTDTTEEPDHEGVEVEWNDLSETIKSKSGQSYVDQRGQYRSISVPFSQVGQTMKAAIETIFASVGLFKSFFIQIQTSGNLSDYVYVKFASEPKIKVSGYDGTNLLYDITLEFDEQL